MESGLPLVDESSSTRSGRLPRNAFRSHFERRWDAMCSCMTSVMEFIQFGNGLALEPMPSHLKIGNAIEMIEDDGQTFVKAIIEDICLGNGMLLVKSSCDGSDDNCILLQKDKVRPVQATSVSPEHHGRGPHPSFTLYDRVDVLISGKWMTGVIVQSPTSSDGSRNKFRRDFLLFLLPLASPSLIVLPHICRGGLRGSIGFPAVGGARAPPAPPLDSSLLVHHKLVNHEHTWLVRNFSTMEHLCTRRQEFEAAGCRWSIYLHRIRFYHYFHNDVVLFLSLDSTTGQKKSITASYQFHVRGLAGGYELCDAYTNVFVTGQCHGGKLSMPGDVYCKSGWSFEEDTCTVRVRLTLIGYAESKDNDVRVLQLEDH